MTKTVKKLLVASVLFSLLAFPLAAEASIYNPSVGNPACLSDPSLPECNQGFCLNALNAGNSMCSGIECSGKDKTNILCLSDLQAGAGTLANGLAPTGVVSTKDIGDLVLKYVNFALPYLTLAAFAGLVYAGFLYVTAYGDDEQLTKAKKIIIYAAVGLILVILSFTIVQFFTKDLVQGLNPTITIPPGGTTPTPGNPNAQ